MSEMKRAIIALMALLGCAAAFAQPDPRTQQDPRTRQVHVELNLSPYAKKIDAILADLDKLMGSGKYSENPATAYKTAREQIRSGKVKLAVDPELKTILSGMAVKVNKLSGEARLCFGPKFLDSYDPKKSIYFSELLHEMRHVYDYATNYEAYARDASDAKEHFWFELDAMHVEAEFIIHYLPPEYAPSRVEKFIATSFKQDGLDSAATYLQKERMDAFFFFNKCEERYAADASQKPAIMGDCVQYAKNVLATYAALPEDDAADSYFYFITLATFEKFFMRLNAVMNETGSDTWQDVFTAYPAVKPVVDSIQEIEARDAERQQSFIDGVTAAWEKELETP
jgi:hypothetical protein